MNTHTSAPALAIGFAEPDAAPLPRYARGEEASEYLRIRWGVEIKASTLSKLRCIGGGPIFRRAGRWPIYEIADLDSWARARRSQKVASTSELVAA